MSVRGGHRDNVRKGSVFALTPLGACVSGFNSSYVTGPFFTHAVSLASDCRDRIWIWSAAFRGTAETEETGMEAAIDGRTAVFAQRAVLVRVLDTKPRCCCPTEATEGMRETPRVKRATLRPDCEVSDDMVINRVVVRRERSRNVVDQLDE